MRLSMGLALLLLPAAATTAQADWRNHLSRTSATDEHPSWEKYAFELPYATQDGELKFEELAKGGKPFVIFFWLSDCPVCHLQMPYVQQLQNLIENGTVDLRLVAISIDDDDRECTKFIEDKDLTFEVLLDRHARHTNDEYKVEDLGTPLTYVFDKDGEFVDYLTGFRNSFAKSVLKLLDIQFPAKVTAGS
jgi:peroxiredoxin